ncbi:MAG: hypothetical protein KDC80_13555 [Saprospiraceae bacterium]|nr:hypothetical protein [Saprospiraceae bacterium]
MQTLQKQSSEGVLFYLLGTERGISRKQLVKVNEQTPAFLPSASDIQIMLLLWVAFLGRA